MSYLLPHSTRLFTYSNDWRYYPYNSLRTNALHCDMLTYVTILDTVYCRSGISGWYVRQENNRRRARLGDGAVQPFVKATEQTKSLWTL